MKLTALTPDHLMQLSALLDQARPEQLLLEAPALAELRTVLSGPGFVPRIYVGVQGGLVQGATGNCAMQLVAADYDVDGAGEHETRFLRAFQSTCVPVEHHVAVDPEVCDSLLADALGDTNACEEHPVEGMAQ